MEERMWVMRSWQALQVEAWPSEGSRQRWRCRWRRGTRGYERWGEVRHRVFNELKGQFGFYAECERKSAEDANRVTWTEISVKFHWSKEKTLVLRPCLWGEWQAYLRVLSSTWSFLALLSRKKYWEQRFPFGQCPDTNHQVWASFLGFTLPL